MKSLKYYLKKAQEEKFAIGQFNFSAFEQVKGIVAAAELLKAPIILGTSEGESKFFGLAEAVAIRNAFRKKTGLPLFLNLDHGKSFEYLKEAMAAGYDMVHFDGSKLPLEENIKISKKVVAWADKKGIVVEGEVGRFSKDASTVYQEQFEINEEDLTKVNEAQEYFQKTKVDLLAVSVGTFHGIDVAGLSPNIKLDRLQEIKNAIHLPLVLHGGSGTPQEDIIKAIQLGICKININTDVRIAFSIALRKFFRENPREITPYKYFPGAVDAVRAVVEEEIKLFATAGKI